MTLAVMAAIGAAAALGVNAILEPERGLLGFEPGTPGAITVLVILGGVLGCASALAVFRWQDRADSSAPPRPNDH